MTISDISVLISTTCTGSPWLMNGRLFSCIACRMSFTPMNARMVAIVVGEVDEAVQHTVNEEVQLAQTHEGERGRREHNVDGLGE